MQSPLEMHFFKRRYMDDTFDRFCAAIFDRVHTRRCVEDGDHSRPGLHGESGNGDGRGTEEKPNEIPRSSHLVPPYR